MFCSFLVDHNIVQIHNLYTVLLSLIQFVSSKFLPDIP